MKKLFNLNEQSVSQLEYLKKKWNLENDVEVIRLILSRTYEQEAVHHGGGGGAGSVGMLSTENDHRSS